jgi:hypothetical protein
MCATRARGKYVKQIMQGRNCNGTIYDDTLPVHREGRKDDSPWIKLCQDSYTHCR